MDTAKTSRIPRFILAIAFLLFVSVLLGAVYLLHARLSSLLGPSASQSDLAPTSDLPCPFTSLSSWKQYYDSFQGYSLCYPRTWTMEPATEEPGSAPTSAYIYTWPKGKPTFNGYDIGAIPPQELRMQISTEDNSSQLSPQQWANTRWAPSGTWYLEGSILVSQQQITSDNTPGLLLEWHHADGSSSLTAVFTRNKVAYLIFAYPANSQHKSELFTLLSTVRFTK